MLALEHALSLWVYNDLYEVCTPRWSYSRRDSNSRPCSLKVITCPFLLPCLHVLLPSVRYFSLCLFTCVLAYLSTFIIFYKLPIFTLIWVIIVFYRFNLHTLLKKQYFWAIMICRVLIGWLLVLSDLTLSSSCAPMRVWLVWNDG